VYKQKLLLALTVILLLSCNNTTGKENKNSADQKISTAAEKNEYSNLITDLLATPDMKTILSQSWEHEDDLEALKGMDDASTIEIPFRSFYFFADGSFLKNPRNAMDYGTWTFDDAAKTITLNYKVEKGKDVYKIAALAADELKLVNKSVNSSTVLKFTGLGKSFTDPANDPYYISNNQWRIKPSKKETDAEIQQRLKDNLHFFILFYRNAIAKNATTASTWGLPSCLKFYGGGIYITKKAELHDAWINCFYNKEQAMKAYDIMDKVMSMKYVWPKDEPNWMKQNLTVLEKMEQNVAAYK
jgi:uncharacterized membrane-anchored protein